MNTDQITPTPTPRTDALEQTYRDTGSVLPWNAINLARELEIDLAREKRRAEDNGRLAHDTAIKLAAERALADRLADTIQSLPAHVKANINPQALAAWKEARGA